MLDIESAVAISPSGRFACRLGQSDSDNDCLHFMDFEQEIYYEIQLETVENFVVIKFYWLDDVHIVVVHHQWGYDEGSIHRHTRILYEFDQEVRKLTALKTVGWQNKSKRDLSGTGYFHVSVGYLTVNEEEYFIYSDVVLSNGNRNFPDNEQVWLRFIPRQFNKEHYNEIDTEIIINYKEARKAVEIDESTVDPSEEYIMTANNNYIYVFYTGLNILVMDIEKCLKLIKETKTMPVYEDFCSKFTIPSPGLRPYRAFVQNECIVLMLKDQDKRYYLRICDFNKQQVSSVNKIDGRLDLPIEDDFHTYPNLFLHPSGHLVQFQTKNYAIRWEHLGQHRSYHFDSRQRHLIKFLKTSTPSRGIVGKLKDLASEQNLLNRVRDPLKLPRCFKEGRELLTMTVEKRC